MERKKASDFPPAVLKLFDGYIHGMISRRDFLDRAARYAVGGFTAAAMLESLTPNYALAQQVAKDDARIKAEYLTYPSPQGSGTMRGYFARPASATGKLPGVVVYHENRGLNPYIEDVARRLAVENFVAFAPDALAPVGGYPGDEEKAAQLFGQLDAKKRTEDLIAAAGFLKSRPECTGKIGAVGFCYGGDIVNILATRMPDLGAAVPFYGLQPSAADTAKIKAPLLIHYAALDQRIDAGWPAFEAALKAHGVRYQMFMYAGDEPRLPQRYDTALRRSRRQAGVVAHDRLLQGKPESLKAHASNDACPPRGIRRGRVRRSGPFHHRHVGMELAAGMRWKVVDQRQLELDVGPENTGAKTAHALEIFGSRLRAPVNIEPHPAVGGLHDLVLRDPCCFPLGQMPGDGVGMDAASFRQAQIVDRRAPGLRARSENGWPQLHDPAPRIARSPVR